jgi:hypothetical protein
MLALAAAAAAVEPVTPRNANSLHAAGQLLHRGVKLSFVNVAIFLSGLRTQKRRGAPRRVACRICLPNQ